MKQTVIQIMETMAVGLMVCFCIGILLAPPDGTEIWGMAAAVSKQMSEHDVKTENAARMDKVMHRDVPKIRVDRPGFQVGEDILLWEQISIQTEETPVWVKADQGKDICPEILEVANETGESLDTSVFQREDSEELGVPLYCDLRSGRVQFYKSGIYRMKIKVTDSYGRVAVKQLTLPVEAG